VRRFLPAGASTPDDANIRTRPKAEARTSGCWLPSCYGVRGAEVRRCGRRHKPSSTVVLTSAVVDLISSASCRSTRPMSD
jgi:hypothetical protein